MVAPIPLSLNARDAKRVLYLGKELVSYGVVNQGEVGGGLLRAMLKNAETQAAPQGQEDSNPVTKSGKAGMTKVEFDAYLKFMAPRLEKAAEAIAQDSENPHKEEIVKGLLRTAEFVRRLTEQKEQQLSQKEAIEREIQRQYMEAYLEKLEKAAEKEQKKEGLSLGSTIGGILDQLVELLGAPEKKLQKDLGKAIGGLEGCRDISAERILDSRATPAEARPVKEFTLNLPVQST
jgi:hypothetical protein